MKHLIAPFLFLISILSIGQTSYSCPINTISQTGYYNIEMSQEVIGLSNEKNFANIRIKDEKLKEVPFFVRSDDPVSEQSNFVEYPLVSNIIKDSLNILVVENPNAENIHRFCIFIANTDVNKTIRLRGSNDQKQWYIVKQQESIGSTGFGKDNQQLIITDFPSGNYKYYEITIANDQVSPLEVLKVGKFESSNIYAQLVEIPLGRFVQTDSTDKKTYIHFPTMEYKYMPTKIEFRIKTGSGYLRKTYFENNRYDSFELSSKKTNTIFLNNVALFKENNIVIENNDNQPLAIDSIKAYGLNRYLCAYLESGKTYTITIDEINTSTPNYDIEHLKSDIPQNLTIAKIGRLTKHTIAEIQKEKSWYEKTIFLWSVLLILGIFLTFICWKVIQEMRKNNNGD